MEEGTACSMHCAIRTHYGAHAWGLSLETQCSCLYACQQSYARPTDPNYIKITLQGPHLLFPLVPLTSGRTLHNGQNRVFCLVHRGFICTSASSSPIHSAHGRLPTSSDSNQIIVLPDLDVRAGIGPQTRDRRALGSDDPRERRTGQTSQETDCKYQLVFPVWGRS